MGSFWQDDKVVEHPELLLIMKTTSEKCGGVVSYVKANHPYQVPEVISVKVHLVFLKKAGIMYRLRMAILIISSGFQQVSRSIRSIIQGFEKI